MPVSPSPDGTLPSIGFIGLGNMGAPMASNLARARYPLSVTDLRPEAAAALVALGATWEPDAAVLAANVDVLITMLPTPAHVRSVFFDSGVAAAMRSGSTWIDMSTSSPEVAAVIRGVLDPLGVTTLDAPVAGMVQGAEAGSLGIYVGGPAEVFHAMRPILGVMGNPERVLHLGGHGAGYVTKLCINLMWFMHELAAAETLAIGVQAGVDLATLQAALVASPANSQVISHDLDSVWQLGDYDESFPLSLVCKDLGLATDLARANGVPAELTAWTEQTFRRARARFGDSAGEMSAVRLYEEAIGRELRYA